MNPFCSYDIRQLFSNQMEKARACIENFTNAELMGTDIKILCANVYEQHKVLALDFDEASIPKPTPRIGKIEKYLDPVRYFDGGRTVLVDGVTLSFSFPYSGDPVLFECRASSYSLSGYPQILIAGNFLTFEYSDDATNAAQPTWRQSVISKLQKDASEIKRGIEFVNNDVIQFNRNLQATIYSSITQKKKNIEVLFKAVEAFDVSVEANAEGRRIIAVQKRNVLPIAHSFDSSEPEYTITDDNYNEILKVIKHTASTWERTPNSFRHMGEEDLRNVLLASLNGLFFGKANGEAFRKDGKTDICIEAESRSAFIAECKMWTGEKAVPDALAQLDSYSTWRDCKTALIYFVDKQDFLAIAEKMKNLLPKLEAIQGARQIDTNEFACQMVSFRTPGHLLTVRVMLFNLHSDDDKKGAKK